MFLWNRRTPQPQGQPNPRKKWVKKGRLGHFFSPAANNFSVGWDWFFFRKQTTRNPTEPNYRQTSCCTGTLAGLARFICTLVYNTQGVTPPPLVLTNFWAAFLHGPGERKCRRLWNYLQTMFSKGSMLVVCCVCTPFVLENIGPEHPCQGVCENDLYPRR